MHQTFRCALIVLVTLSTFAAAEFRSLPLPALVGNDNLRSGIFLSVETEEVGQSLQAVVDSGDTDARVVQQIISAAQRRDPEAYTKLTWAPAEKVAGELSFISGLLKDVRDPKLLRKFRVAQITYFVLTQDGAKLPFIPIVLRKKESESRHSMESLGHPVFENISAHTRASLREPKSFAIVDHVVGDQSIEFSVADTPIGQAPQVRFSGTRLAYPILIGNAEVPVVPDAIKSALQFYESQIKHLHEGRIDAYLGTFDTESRSSIKEALAEIGPEGLKMYQRDKGAPRYVVYVVASEDLYFLFHSKKKNDLGMAAYDILRVTKDGFQGVNAYHQASLDSLLTSPNVFQGFKSLIVKTAQ